MLSFLFGRAEADRRTDMMKPILDLRTFANASKNDSLSKK